MVNIDPPRKQFKGLQALRFIAAVSVVIHHSLFYAHERLDPSVIVWGIGAVELFFTISGFVAVVSTRRFQESPQGWKYFLVRRGTRILPMYWIATTVKVLTLLAVPAVVLHATFHWESIALSYVVLPSVNIDGKIAPVLGVAWTLLFESFFIVVFALCLLIRWRPILLAGILLSAAALANLLRPDDYGPFLVYFSPYLIYYVLGLVIGTFAKRRNAVLLIAGLLWVYALHFILQPLRNDTLIRITVIVALMLIIVLAESWLERRLPTFIVNLGNSSYTLYLFHPLIAPAVPAAMAVIGVKIGWLAVVGSVLVAVCAALILYRWVEAPMTRYLQAKLPLAGNPPRPQQSADPA